MRDPLRGAAWPGSPSCDPQDGRPTSGSPRKRRGYLVGPSHEPSLWRFRLRPRYPTTAPGRGSAGARPQDVPAPGAPPRVPAERGGQGAHPGALVAFRGRIRVDARDRRCRPRSALEDDAQQPRFLRTVHGVGYAFCAEAADLARPRPTRSVGATSYRLVLKDREVALHAGENVLGRVEEGVAWRARIGRDDLAVTPTSTRWRSRVTNPCYWRAGANQRSSSAKLKTSVRWSRLPSVPVSRDFKTAKRWPSGCRSKVRLNAQDSNVASDHIRGFSARKESPLTRYGATSACASSRGWNGRTVWAFNWRERGKVLVYAPFSKAELERVGKSDGSFALPVRTAEK
jgi:hypothetical protein